MYIVLAKNSLLTFFFFFIIIKLSTIVLLPDVKSPDTPAQKLLRVL